MRKIAAVALVLAGCSTISQAQAFEVRYLSDDRPEDRRIYITYTNDTKQDVCFYPTNWPEKDGRIDTGAGRVFIKLGDKAYFTADYDSGYCPGCVVRVEPGRRLTGFFNYEDFSLPQEDYNKAKTLNFHPLAFNCTDR